MGGHPDGRTHREKTLLYETLCRFTSLRVDFSRFQADLRSRVLRSCIFTRNSSVNLRKSCVWCKFTYQTWIYELVRSFVSIYEAICVDLRNFGSCRFTRNSSVNLCVPIKLIFDESCCLILVWIYGKPCVD